MARGRRRAAVRSFVRRARPAIRRRASSGARSFIKSRGQFGKSGILQSIEQGLGRGMLYGGVANKIFPGIAPIATLYGEYSAGGLTSLAINELLVKPFIGQPSVLSSVLGSTGLGGILGNLTGGSNPMSMGMSAAV